MEIGRLAIALGAVLLVALRILAFEAPRNLSLRYDYRHRWLIKDARAVSRQLPVSPTAVVTKGAYTRPSMLHWILSKFPPDIDRIVYRWTGGVSELGFVAVLISIGLWDGNLPLTAFGVAVVVVLLTPQFVRVDRPGNPGFDPTVFGLVLSTVGVVSVLPWVVGGSALWLGAATIATGLVVLSDRVAWLSHGIVMLAIAIVEPLTILVLIGGVVMSAILSGGLSVRYLAAHVKFLLNGIRDRSPYAVSGSGWARFRKQAGVQLPDTVPGSVASLLGFNPFVITGLVTVVAWRAGAIALTPVETVFAVWMVAASAGFVLTTVPRLDVAGPADAYLLGAVVPAAVLTGLGVVTLGIPYLLVASAFTLVGAVLSVTSRRERERSDSDQAWTELIETLNQFEPGVVLLDPADRAAELAFDTEHRVTDSLHNEEASTNDLSILFSEQHLHLPDGPNAIKNVKYYYNPDWAVFDRKRVYLPDSVPQSADPIFENGRYYMYEFDDLMRLNF